MHFRFTPKAGKSCPSAVFIVDNSVENVEYLPSKRHYFPFYVNLM